MIPGRRGVRWLLAVCAAAGACAVACSAASAGVVLGPRQIVVVGRGASATIDRRPFRLTIRGASGGAVLSEVANPGAAPKVLAPTVYPPAFGARPTPDGTGYAPLTFLVGTATTAQWSQAFWQGDQLSGLQTGIQYAARDVIAARAAGDGVELTLSTNDPSGRRLLVTVAPSPGATVRVRALASPSRGVALISDAFSSDGQEAFHGFGGRHNAIDQHGHDFYSWIEQENITPPAATTAVVGAATGQPNYLFPTGPTAAYQAQALFYSSRPYGFLLDQPELARWRMDADRPDAWRVDVYGSHLKYVVAPSPAARAIGSLTAITGRQPVPPAWSLGTLIDRVVRAQTPETPAQVVAEVRGDIANFQRYHLRVDAYRFEGWALLPAPVLRSLIGALRRRGIHPLVYFRAFVANPTGGFEPATDLRYAISHHYVPTTAQRTPATFTSPFGNGTAALIDFSDPPAVRWWQSRVRAALDAGADGFMQDFGEEVAVGWHFHDGETGATMHNRYPILYERATRELIDAYERRHPGRHIFFFTRAGYSGDPGSYAYDSANFLGDNTTSYDHASGLASVAPDMLNRGIGGAFGSTTDIGGYEDLTTGGTTKELLLRWAELAALTPFFRLHNSGNAGTQMPWAFDAQTVAVYERYAAVHRSAQGLITRLWRTADATGVPIMRPLWLADPGDAAAAGQDEEWLLGPDVLVAPVVTEGARARSVFFPPGCWRDAETSRRYRGPLSATVAAPLAALPYFERCGRTPLR